jgi:uncharacterized protein YjiS (DUF1127 family)
MSLHIESRRITGVRVPVHPFAWIGVVMSRIAHAALAELHRRKAIRELQTFDDRMLADIGLQRCDIESAVSLGRRSPSIRMPGS